VHADSSSLFGGTEESDARLPFDALQRTNPEIFHWMLHRHLAWFVTVGEVMVGSLDLLQLPSIGFQPANDLSGIHDDVLLKA
jgi:hypothetical protein